MNQVYIVDDDFDIIHSLSLWLQRKNFSAQGFSNSKELFTGLERELPDVILLDVGLGTEDGRHVCRQIRKLYSKTIPIILFSMKYDSLIELKDSCADDYIKKDAHLREITALLQEHIKIEEE